MSVVGGGLHQQYLREYLEHRCSLATSIIPQHYHAHFPQI